MVRGVSHTSRDRAGFTAALGKREGDAVRTPRQPRTGDVASISTGSRSRFAAPDFDSVMHDLSGGSALDRVSARPDPYGVRPPSSPKRRPMLLMDETHAFLTRYRSHIPGVRRAARLLLNELRRAERFVLDDEAVRLVTDLSSDRSDRVLRARYFLARRPCEVTWIEYDHRVRMHRAAETGSLRGDPYDPETSSERAGLLIFRDGTRVPEPRWVCHQFLPWNDDEVLQTPIAYVFDPDGDPLHPVLGSDYWRVRRSSDVLPPIRAAMENDRDIEGLTDSDSILLGAPLEVRGDGRLACAPEYLTRGCGVLMDRNSELRKHVLDHVLQFAGDLNWVITLLAAISSLPREFREAHHAPGVRRAGSRILPYFQHRTISIRVPSDDRVAWSHRTLDRAYQATRNSPNAWHRVRGHWMAIQKTYGRRCHHEPELIEPGVGLCPKCNLLVRWREYPDGRGDPSVGIVDHDYRVRGPKRRPASGAVLDQTIKPVLECGEPIEETAT